MKNFSFFLLLCSLFLFSTACDENETTTTPMGPEVLSADEIAILCIGDSRVEGLRPQYESYRYEFWKNMVNAGYSINLIGPFEDPAAYPDFMGMPFDDDHAGVGGDQTEDVINRLDIALGSASRQPDVILLGIGGNDLLDGGRTVEAVISNIVLIIDSFQAANPNVLIVVEKIAGVNPDFPEATPVNSLLDTFAAQIDQVASEQTTAGSRVVAVDMNNNFTCDPANYADPVHYSAAGAKEIASRYFEVVDKHIR